MANDLTPQPPLPQERGSQRRFGIASLLLALAALAVMVLAGCGTKGQAPTLAAPVQVTLHASGDSATLGHATLTPAYGTHVVVYMHGKLIPYSDPQTPVQLRLGSCYGQVVAPLTENAPTGGSQVEVRPDTQKGANVAHAVDANWYVVVLESSAPDAKPISCGHPLSDLRQYFDLYEPAKVDQGVGLGIALFESITITQVNVSLAKATPRATQWSIHKGGCAGGTLGSGPIAAEATTASGIVFAPLDTGQWWLALTPDGADAPAACVKAG